ncbi:aldehyde dehydrogenase family protein [Rhizorhabdus histidinilytica]
MADYDRADTRVRRFQNLIDGQSRPAANGGWIDSIDPATGQVWAQIPDGRADDVDAAVAAAKRAFRGPWRQMAAAQRAALLRKVADLVAPGWRSWRSSRPATTARSSTTPGPETSPRSRRCSITGRVPPTRSTARRSRSAPRA